MNVRFGQYVSDLYNDVPVIIYEGLLFIGCMGTLSIITIIGWKCGWKQIVGLLLTEYVFLIYCSTVFCRKVSEDVGHNYIPFWSYEAIKNGRTDLIDVNIMNVVVFEPVGLLLGLITLKTHKARKNYRTRISRLSLIVGIGLIISCSIEALQFFLKRGFSEFDDVFHNTLGCLIGFLMVAIIKGIWLLQKRY